jgi:cell wall-associated NlpC family hydrolase
MTGADPSRAATAAALLPPPVPQLARAARGYLGVPWRHRGRDRNGLDCLGLVVLAARGAGLAVAEPAEPYARGARGPELLEALAAHCARVPLPDAAEGDVLAFADGAHVAHLGVRTTLHGRPGVLHAHVRRRRVVEEQLIGALADGLRSAWRPLEAAVAGRG